MGFGSILFEIIGLLIRFIFVNAILFIKGKPIKGIGELTKEDGQHKYNNRSIGGFVVIGFVIMFAVYKCN